MVFSGLKKQVIDVMHHTGLFERITQANLFPAEEMAFAAIYQRMGRQEGVFFDLGRKG
jgi:SulP family sulfate permease